MEAGEVALRRCRHTSATLKAVQVEFGGAGIANFKLAFTLVAGNTPAGTLVVDQMDPMVMAAVITKQEFVQQLNAALEKAKDSIERAFLEHYGLFESLEDHDDHVEL